jgi:propionate catabolism operon transcriptional regulator
MRSVSRKPILWAFSQSKLGQLLESVVPHYDAVAQIRVFQKGYDEAVELIRERAAAGESPDAIVCSGLSGAFLRERAGLPAVMIAPTGFDILQALARARRLASRVGLLMFGEVPAEVAQFRDAFGLSIDARSYSSREEAEAAVSAMATAGVEVIVGPGRVTDLAESAGLKSIYLYSREAVHDALRRAIEIARAARAEEAKREHIDALLAPLAEGVIAVDSEERIRSINPAMVRILGKDAGKSVGAKLSSLAPGLSAARVLQSGAPEYETAQRLNGRLLMAHRVPLREHGVQVGAALAFQDAGGSDRAERSQRSEARPRSFVARRRISDLVGSSAAVAQCRALAERYARTGATVLITGESGTGKELIAQGIHNASSRSQGPFVAVNCAAFAESLLESELFGYEEGAFTGSRRGGKPGLFEAAHQGTIFLDEIGDMPLAPQTRLLRVLQEREVLRLGSNEATPIDVRVIAATNRELEEGVAAGTFRKDLYYRLNILHLHLPPVSERAADIPVIARHLLARALQRHGSSMEADAVLRALLPKLRRYQWPGNVREMDNVLERVAVICAEEGAIQALSARQLAAVVPEIFGRARRESAAAPLAESRRETEREIAMHALEECGGNRAMAAERLGISRTTLWRKLGGK